MASVFLGCFAFGLLFTVASFLLGAFGGGHEHLYGDVHDGGADPGANHAGGTGSVHISPFNISAISAFLTWFGGAGYLLSRYSGLTAIAIALAATAVGIVGAGTVFVMLSRFLLPRLTEMRSEDYRPEGAIARVTSPIRQGGTGEIVYTLAGTQQIEGARSLTGEALERGTEVVIHHVEAGIAYVERWDKFAEQNALPPGNGGDSGIERYVASPDPDFEQKAADIIGLYLKPPEHAVVFCVDEKTSIQALDRRDPVLPLSPGRAERHGFEYVRHGALSLYAALNVGTGEIEGMTAARHTSAEFLAFLNRVLAAQRARGEIHLILDNFSAHKTKAVTAWLAAHPRVHFHYTPTYSSWLNQVELWFAKIERDCIARGIFTSTTDLRRKLMHYIRTHNKHCHPFVWNYSDPTRRIRASGN